MRAFERVDPFFDFSETFYYGDVQASFNRPFAGVGVRYKDEEIGFDATLSGSYSTRRDPAIAQAQASVLYFPTTDYFYCGLGGGFNVYLEPKIRAETYVRANVGVEFRTEDSGKYFAEMAGETISNFNPKEFKLIPGFRLGIGF